HRAALAPERGDGDGEDHLFGRRARGAVSPVTVHGRADSSNVQKVLWAFEELGRATTRIDRGARFGGLDDPEFAALTPVRRIPVVVDGDLALWESNAILRHYARASGRFWPGDAAGAARAEAAMDWALGSFWPTVREPFRAVWTGGMTRGTPAVTEMLAEAGATLPALDRIVAPGWAAGDGFTFAEIPLAVALHRLFWTAPDTALPPAAADWWRRVSARPGYIAHVFGPGER
ncbi:MAG: glutathione S-transferase N-terminal domain-containing protein, partial [Pseudomonadota bacterium]